MRIAMVGMLEQSTEPEFELIIRRHFQMKQGAILATCEVCTLLHPRGRLGCSSGRVASLEMAPGAVRGAQGK